MDSTEYNEIRETLAAYAHEAWSGWMNYLLSKSTVNDDGTWTIPVRAVDRWYRQMSTPYADLPENEKKSDRAEADKMLAILHPQQGAGEIKTLREDFRRAYDALCMIEMQSSGNVFRVASHALANIQEPKE